MTALSIAKRVSLISDLNWMYHVEEYGEVDVIVV